MTEPAGDDEGIARDELRRAFERGDEDAFASIVDRLVGGDSDRRRGCLRWLKRLTADDPGGLGAAAPALERLLHDDDRSVRLTTAKLFVSLADADPEAVLPVLSSLVDRLDDDGEFYYVRARAAEALGYLAVAHPDEVATPDVVANLRVGLAYDEPEVTEKLAKALEYVALGNPGRLRHRVSSLAGHLDDENEFVRYHLCTALAAVGCEHPESLDDAIDPLLARLEDENSHVRARAVETLGILARSGRRDGSVPKSTLDGLLGDEEPFVVDRARFAVQAIEGADADRRRDGIGTVDGIKATTGNAVDAIAAPNGDGECPHCGLGLPEGGPPLCPRCGGPH